MRHRIPALALTVIAGLVPLAGCGSDNSSSGDSQPAADSGTTGATQPAGGGGASAPAAQNATVDISDFKYGPATVTVKTGGTVEWTNNDTAPHTATAEDQSFDTGSLDQGDSAKVTFDKAGTFAYVCSFHPFMHGTVEVTG
jgi:plastocyanin